VWRAAGDVWSTALTFWTLQLAVNGMWTWLFFGRHRMDLALADIAATALFIAGFLVEASSLSPIAGVLFLPYAAWVGFAALLNATIWKLNRSTPRRHEGQAVAVPLASPLHE